MGKNRNKKHQKGLNKTQKDEVKALNAKGREDKVAGTNEDDVYYNSRIEVGDLHRLLPAITVGELEGQRIGNEITAKTLRVQGLVNAVFTAADANSKIGVRIFMFSVKGYANAEAAIDNSADWIGALLRNGPDVRPFVGQTRDFFLPYNSELITMHKEKRMILTSPMVYQTGLLPPPVTTEIPIQQFNAVKYWKASIKCHNKKLRFSAATAGAGPSDKPTNWGPIIAVGYCRLGGYTPDTGLNLQMSTSSQLTYEDA